MPLPRWCQLPAWLVLPGRKLHTNVLLCLCKQAKNTVVLLLGGLGVQRGWEGSWGQAAPGERRHTEAQSHGWICKDRQTDSTSPQHCCPAVLLSCCPAQLSLRCQLSSHQCSRCVRDVTRNAPGLCASLLKRNFCLFHSISVLGVVMQGPVSCRVLSPPGTAPQSAGVTPSAGPLC